MTLSVGTPPDSRLDRLCSLSFLHVPPHISVVFTVSHHLDRISGRDRLLVLNRIARSVIEKQRGKDSEWVFPYKGKPLHGMLTTAWKSARQRAGLAQVRVHDLKHSFGYRLRSAGVSLEDRKALLGHKTDDITTHYSAPDIGRLMEAANKVCDGRKLTVLRAKSPTILPQSCPTKGSARLGAV